MALARARRGSGMNYWPGFVDALSTLILSIIFLLTVFVVMQFYLQQDVANKNSALTHLSAQIAYLGQLLSMEKTDNSNLKDQVAQLRTNLTSVEGERSRAQAAADAAQAAVAAGQDKLAAEQNKLNDVTGELSGQKQISSDALAQVQTLNQQIAALRDQLSSLAQTLDVSQKKNEESDARIKDLGQQLNLALAEKVNELNRYRSNFFGKLSQILGDRPDIHVVGDRFVFQSEVFFDSGRADLKPEGRVELDKLAAVLLDLQKSIPGDIAWVLRVDGHTDVRPVTGLFKSNWDLSSARAISVVQYLISKGLPPQRLVAAGFGEFQPIDTGNTEDAYRRNRRIEFKLTER
ncbi:MAG TPA: peptidoglycan -binding protein [Xanthobacteraceae bacterium]|jgi:chemotaxis protein MotB|nr:peptidoglycan -binding protein [Xanthobacteraceae bacterium]